MNTGQWVDKWMRAFPGDLIAFAATMIPGRNEYGVGVAVLGDAGYAPTEKRFDTYEEASAFCDEANPLTGMSEKMSTLIIMDTMRRSEHNRRKAEGFISISLRAGDARTLLDALDEVEDFDVEDVRDTLSEALADWESEAVAA